jgi:hypothetical protein
MERPLKSFTCSKTCHRYKEQPCCLFGGLCQRQAENYFEIAKWLNCQDFIRMGGKLTDNASLQSRLKVRSL